jgi:hypothetical protein
MSKIKKREFFERYRKIRKPMPKPTKPHKMENRGPRVQNWKDLIEDERD